ncbi:uncharacterized protein MONOS_14857 [Monocercomonoides exilis]|uniref:uncharacterized protein n=1 Tax=Monocercomonoides exilis TaxID=2049356 RepID=UPI00355A3A41|nr:hypothetical protein MONOS_14857 [Monocercomonoides exilis]|eukprot:MONOS_14857.1-p1 / transcript=MONOS_14857.1 / gene=MONOS_14857 / organism=Monocercomonoides_exilis_PA203 / gene_product=unspecified product / transcript_product=unspecified product / location=Mono_scaffold01087:15775-16431(+) / protein_length=218 / sequence_SO=supercontig / SO=protein_coding / is_pseudo=false
MSVPQEQAYNVQPMYPQNAYPAPGQNYPPVQQGQPTIVYTTTQPTQVYQPNLHDPRTYEGINWSSSISTSVSGGVPAWGQGQFESSIAYLAWFASFFGFAGMQRIYLGDIIMGVLCCLTGGFCCIGQCVDLCTIGSMVESRNAEILNSVREKMKVCSQAPQTVIQVAQPNYIPPANYPTAYSAQPCPAPAQSLPAQSLPAQPPENLAIPAELPGENLK